VIPMGGPARGRSLTLRTRDQERETEKLGPVILFAWLDRTLLETSNTLGLFDCYIAQNSLLLRIPRVEFSVTWNLKLLKGPVYGVLRARPVGPPASPASLPSIHPQHRQCLWGHMTTNVPFLSLGSEPDDYSEA
jgi:hypothetical protein